MAQLSVAPTVPVSAKPVPYGERWRLAGVYYHGCPVYINNHDGTMAYEESGTQLISLSEEDEERIVDLLVDQWYAQEGLMVAAGEVN